MAKLYFYYSAMNAGKTTTLLQSAYNYRERGMRTLILTPRLDDRGGRGGVVASRIGLRAEGTAFDREGNPTRDPKKAGEGAYASWGGHKGSGLAMCVQMLGMMANTLPFPPLVEGCGFLILAMKADLFMPLDEFKGNVSEYATSVRAAKPLDPARPVRMPFDRSAAQLLGPASDEGPTG